MKTRLPFLAVVLTLSLATPLPAARADALTPVVLPPGLVKTMEKVAECAPKPKVEAPVPVVAPDVLSLDYLVSACMNDTIQVFLGQVGELLVSLSTSPNACVAMDANHLALCWIEQGSAVRVNFAIDHDKMAIDCGNTDTVKAICAAVMQQMTVTTKADFWKAFAQAAEAKLPHPTDEVAVTSTPSAPH